MQEKDDNRRDDNPTHVNPSNNMDDNPTHVIPSNSMDDNPTHVIPSNSMDDNPTHVIPSNSIDDFSDNVLDSLNIINFIPDAACICNYLGNVIRYNDLFQRMRANVSPQTNEIFDIWDNANYTTSFYDAKEIIQTSKELVTHIIGYDEESCIEWIATGTAFTNFIMVTARDLTTTGLYKAYKTIEIYRRLNEEMLAAFAVNAEQHNEVSKRKEKETLQQFQLNEALVRSQALTDILETKRHFVRAVSHEVRTPLNVVVSGLQYLTSFSENMDENVQETLEEITVSCGVAIDILTDLLTYEKIEGGVQELEMRECSMEAMVMKVLEQFRVQSRQNGVTLSYSNNFSSCEGAMVMVMADDHKLGQVIRNLVSNAVKFSNRGQTQKGIVTVELILLEPERDGADRWIRFQVQDNGPGISKPNQARLFHEIVQFKPNELQKGAGSGLGLWISRGIINLHQGRIGVTSDGEGLGSTFFLELKVSKVGDGLCIVNDFKSVTFMSRGSFNVSRSLMSDVIIEKLETVYFRGTILLVDDSAAVRKMNKKILKADRFTFIEAENGLEAVERVCAILEQGKEFSLILMDSSMPVLDGGPATSLIRRMGYVGKIFGLTGNALTADREVFLSHGVDTVSYK
jgi:signal transduction histidine kinase